MTTDHVKKPGMSLQALEKFLNEIQIQPKWRAESDRCADYYDGNQLPPEVVAQMRERGQPILIHNLIAPAIDGVLGLEAKTRTDWKVQADDDEGLDVALALNEKLHEAARLALSDRACADAYKAMVVSGLGWVEVNRSSDPFGSSYRVNYVHRREMFYDWHSAMDLHDARWLMRRKWLDVDELALAFPQHKQLIAEISKSWAGWDNWDELTTLMDSPDLVGAYNTQRDSHIAVHEWWDSQRERAMTNEVYYRVWEKKPVCFLPDGRRFVFKEDNPLHLKIAAMPDTRIVMSQFTRMRLAYFVGPHRLVDVPSPHPHNEFPYVPFFGFREDNTGVPYGIVRRMLPAQDEINFRRSKLTQELNKFLVIKDEDAVLDMSDNQLLDELHRGDGVITLNEKRQNRDHNAFRVESGGQIANQQFQVMQDAQKLIQDVAGIYASFLGQNSNAASGVAIDSLVEQSTTTLSELNDNYRFARTKVGELLMAFVVQDIGKTEMPVQIDANKPQPTRTVVLNQHSEEGEINNDIHHVKTRVVLTDVTKSPGYRAQMQRTLLEVMGQVPPEIQMVLVDLMLEMNELPNRDEVLKRIRQATGQAMDPKDITPEMQAEMQRKAEMAQKVEEMQMQQMGLQLEKLAGEVQQLNAKSAESEGKVQKMATDEQKTLAEIERIRAEIKQIVTDVVSERRAMGESPL